MKDNDIDNLLREKANQVDDSKYNFKINIDEIKRKADSKKKAIIIKISFASALAACLILGALFFISRNAKTSEGNVVLQGNEENEIYTEIEYKSYLLINNDSLAITDDLPDNIFIVEVTEVINNKLLNGKPNTVVKAKVIKNLFGELEKETEFTINTCLIRVNELSEDVKRKIGVEDNGEEIIRIVNDELMLTTPYPIVGNKYLVSTLNINNEKNVVDYYKYSFYEYDEDNEKIIKNGELIDIDI